MSSKFKGLRRVGIVGLSTVVAASMMSFSAVSAQANWATAGGDIGLVDTNTTLANTQGATLVTPGAPGQALGDMRILVPNLFKSGDTIDLTIFDRTATNTDPGDINADLAHRLSFTTAPTVKVSATPVAATTNVGPTSASPFNTEGTVAAGNAPTAAIAGAATTVPAFTTTLVSSSRGAGLTPKATDIVRLTVGNLSAGTDVTAKWVITVSGVTADLGTSVSPGELRVVPFAYNGAPNTTSSNFSDMFAGNEPDPTEATPPQIYNPKIKLYTVPAYVAPVTFNVGAPNNIVADGTSQTIGDITIAETNGYSLQNGTYTVTIVGADIANTTAPTVTVTGAATNETVTTTTAGNVLTFVIAGADQTGKLSIKISGLLLTSSTPGPITYTLAGGSIDDPALHSFLVTAGTSLEIPAGFTGTPGTGGVAKDADFGPTVNQTDIDAPPLRAINSFSSDVVHRIGGGDRYETAAKIALNNGRNDYVVLASGADFPDALSGGYLANRIGGGSILLTAPNSLPVVTATTMRELGTRTVFILGGTGAVSAGVEAQLKATPQYYGGGEETIGQGMLNVVRLGGSDRYATNKVVNQYAAAFAPSGTPLVNPVGRTSITSGQASKLTAIVATGAVFADALSAGPATHGTFRAGQIITGALPLILTTPGSLNSDASSQLNNLGIQQAVIVGGPGAVSAGVETSIAGLGVATYRLGGANRFETSAMIADFETAPVAPTATVKGGLGFDSNVCTRIFETLTVDCQRAYLATGVDFADALAGAPLAGGSGSPILLTNPTPLSPETKTWLTAHASTYQSIVALGLAGAVSNAALDAANAAIAGG